MANTSIIIYLFIIISIFIKCDDVEPPIYGKCEYNLANDKYDCFDRISEDEKNDGYHCCYGKRTDSTGSINYKCYLLEKDEYEDIDGTEDKFMYSDGLRDLNIECENRSNIQIYKYIYLVFTLLNLIV